MLAVLAVLAVSLTSARDAWADGVDFGISLTGTDWAKLIAIVVVVLVVCVATIWKVSKSVGKFAGAVRREMNKTPSLPTARLHREDGSVTTGSENRDPAAPVTTPPERA